MFMEYTVTSLVKSIWAFVYTGITEQLDTSMPYVSILTSPAKSVPNLPSAPHTLKVITTCTLYIETF
jgi:hypothetical protein